MDSIFPDKDGIDAKLLDISSQIDEFTGYSSQHSARMTLIADVLAVKFGLSSRDRSVLRQACLLHDVGELSMNREYIGSTRGLSTAEMIDLHRHPVIGEQETAKLGLERGVQLLVRWHHEWWNGTGYPDAIEGEQIPLAARILRVVDTYCALTSDRTFRKAINDIDSKKYLTEWAGIEFDPAVVMAFLSIEMPPKQQSESVIAAPVNEQLLAV